MSEKQKAQIVYMSMRDIKRQVHVMDYYCQKITKLFDELARARGNTTTEISDGFEFDFAILNSNVDSEVYKLAKTLSCMAPHMSGDLADLFLRAKDEWEGAK